MPQCSLAVLRRYYKYMVTRLEALSTFEDEIVFQGYGLVLRFEREQNRLKNRTFID